MRKFAVSCLIISVVFLSVAFGEPPAKETIPTEFDIKGLPKKLGVSGTWVWQEQEYNIDQFEITSFTVFGFPIPGPPPFGPGTIQSINNQADSYTTRLDYWILPFLNVYGILGHVNGEVDVTLGGPINQTFNFDYNGTVYGAGAVVALGWEQYFASTDVSYTITSLSDGASIETWVASPKIGIKRGKLTAWVGGTYQATSHEQAGNFLLPPATNIGYNVVLSDANNWNYTAGFMWEFCED